MTSRRREVYQRLKTAFSSTAETKSVNPIRLIDKDDDAINRTVGFEQVNFEGVNRNDDWMRKYLDYLALPFVFDKDLLVRLIRDITDYFVIESKRLLATNPSNNSAALQSS
ncbi:unnamed protein product [Rotaria sordida]|uniref:Uncharacterized protein n=1 Tax=Rotaria sordida TaxID=392033 RepID=A0A814FM87_9BILA|nr:unnamed protein product [Rotaria sordida]CAF3659111.1 unnamed protein product [Rotaria sordida]